MERRRVNGGDPGGTRSVFEVLGRLCVFLIDVILILVENV
jgi:hypothetical protein